MEYPERSLYFDGEPLHDLLSDELLFVHSCCLQLTTGDHELPIHRPREVLRLHHLEIDLVSTVINVLDLTNLVLYLPEFSYFLALLMCDVHTLSSVCITLRGSGPFCFMDIALFITKNLLRAVSKLRGAVLSSVSK